MNLNLDNQFFLYKNDIPPLKILPSFVINFNQKNTQKKKKTLSIPIFIMESTVQRFSEQEVSHAKHDGYESSSLSDEEIFDQNNVSKSLMTAIRNQLIG